MAALSVAHGWTWTVAHGCKFQLLGAYAQVWETYFV